MGRVALDDARFDGVGEDATKKTHGARGRSRTAPDDLHEPGKEPSMQGQVSFRVEPRSSAILLTDHDEVSREN